MPALSLFITAASTTKPLTPLALQSLRENLPFFHAAVDSKIRSEVISSVRRMTIRIRGGISTLLKNSRPSTESVKSQEGTALDLTDQDRSASLLKQHRFFLEWYIEFLLCELGPTASYQRHISALKVVHMLLQSGIDDRILSAYLSKLGQDQVPWAFSIQIVQPWLVRTLLDLMLDPFEDVRASASTVVATCFLGLRDTRPCDTPHDLRSIKENGDIENQDRRQFIRLKFKPRLHELSIFLGRTERIASATQRTDHADAVAHFMYLIYKIASQESFEHNREEVQLSLWYSSRFNIVTHIISRLEATVIGDRDLSTSALPSVPLHGYFAALR